MLEYEIFGLKIGPLKEDGYHVTVNSPQGQVGFTFKLLLAPKEVDRIILNLAEEVRGPPTRRAAEAAGTSLRDIGEQLFNSLFSGPVLSLFSASLATARQRDKGLRIRLHIDLEDPDLRPLAGLPWEFMYRRETRDFLNLSRQTPIVRYLDVPLPSDPLSYEPPLRILVVISNPIDRKQLDLAREKALIEAAWGKKENVQVEFLGEATPEALHRKLSVSQFHVLHYMGHGDFDERTGQGSLVFEDQRGYSRLIGGESLSVLLQDAPTLRLVCLNACQTARAAEGEGLDPFSGAATALVMAGIPAVVAMQFEITDRAALTFAETFYPLLAQGQPVDAAMAEARKAIYLAEPNTLEWGTPVLFMRTPDGMLFKPSEVPPVAEVPEPAPLVAKEPEPTPIDFSRFTDAELEDIRHRWGLLKIHLRNLRHLENQRDQYGKLGVPVHITNQIEGEEKEAIRLLKTFCPTALGLSYGEVRKSAQASSVSELISYIEKRYGLDQIPEDDW